MTSARPGAVYRLTVAATAPDPAERMACVAPARNAVRTAAAAGWGVDGGVLDDLVAIAGELLANAARHTGPARIRALLVLEECGGRLRFEVEDQGAALPCTVDGFGDDRAESRRGLLMVRGLSDRWGSRSTVTGKVVWAELDLPAPLDVAGIAAWARQGAARADYMRAAIMGADPVRKPTCRRAREKN
ncbi:ATP-binding protein [Kitasatospora sp. NPDC101155]|uniref:ATP-binding protein n=1 Tax=Kitasatospora sp. NPDC101155 TaxID=3364097 RepID=UPI00380BAE96